MKGKQPPPFFNNSPHLPITNEYRSSNSSYVNGRRAGKGFPPVELHHGDVIGIVTNINDRRDTILGLVFREERDDSATQQYHRIPTLPTTTPPALTNPEDAAAARSVSKKPLKRPRVTSGTEGKALKLSQPSCSIDKTFTTEWTCSESVRTSHKLDDSLTR